MRASKKADRAMEQLAALLTKHGMAVEQVEAIKETAPTSRDAISRQAEAVLLFLETPAKFTTKLCKRCGEAFGTNYRAVSFCSDNCRAREMEKQLGIKWNWYKPEEERWGGEPPLVIPPPALQKIQQLLQWFADTLPTQTEIQNQPPSMYSQSQVPLNMPAFSYGKSHDDGVVHSVNSKSQESKSNIPPVLLPQQTFEQGQKVDSVFDFE